MKKIPFCLSDFAKHLEKPFILRSNHMAWCSGGGGVTSTHNKPGCAIFTKKVAPKNPEVT